MLTLRKVSNVKDEVKSPRKLPSFLVNGVLNFL